MNGFDSSHVCALEPILWRFAISDQYGDGEFYSDRIHGIKILVDASSLTLFRSVKSISKIWQLRYGKLQYNRGHGLAYSHVGFELAV